MLFSVYDPDRKVYYYFAARQGFSVRTRAGYSSRPFVPWQDAEILLPEDAAPAGQGPEPKGIVAHYSELMRPACEPPEKDWFWLGALVLARWFLFPK